MVNSVIVKTSGSETRIQVDSTTQEPSLEQSLMSALEAAAKGDLTGFRAGFSELSDVYRDEATAQKEMGRVAEFLKTRESISLMTGRGVTGPRGIIMPIQCSGLEVGSLTVAEGRGTPKLVSLQLLNSGPGSDIDCNVTDYNSLGPIGFSS
ncbi:hypothetical protein ACFL6C_04260 [Myxococcota bacterium]